MEDIDDRRKFLASCGRFAVITPPAMTMLLSTSLTSTAIAQSGGRHADGGGGGGSMSGCGDPSCRDPNCEYGKGAGGGTCGDHTPPTDDDELPAWIERMQRENPDCTLDEILRSRPSATLRVKG